MLLFYDCSSVTFNLPLIYTIFSLIHTSSVVFVLLYCSWLVIVQFYLGVVLISYFWYINTWIRYFITYCTSPFLVVLVDFTLINKIPTSFWFSFDSLHFFVAIYIENSYIYEVYPVVGHIHAFWYMSVLSLGNFYHIIKTYTLLLLIFFSLEPTYIID